MKKQRKYLKDLIPVNINKLVLETGYFELQLESGLLSLSPERHPNGRYYVCLFKDNLRQPITWEIASQPHTGRLQHGGHIPYRCDEKYFVVGSDGRRYAHLFIDPEEQRIGVRTDFFPKPWQGYPRRGSKDEDFRSQAKRQYEELFGEKDEFLRDYKRLLKRSYLGI